MFWTENELQVLPEKKDFRLRGTEMTRLETFSDAAFAFATTMLVISVATIPGSYDELLQALKGVPAFGLSFVQIMMFWVGHRAWSRRYGLEDTPSTITSLALIFIMFVYVYPLRLIFSALFAWLSQGWLPSEFGIQNRSELAGLFVVYGLGFSALSGSLAVLYLRARSVAKSLGLNSLERVRTSEEVMGWSLMSLTGLLSAAFAWLTPITLGIYAGFVYFLLPISMPPLAIRYAKKARAVEQLSLKS